jgi:AraC-like DNA-binding protein
MLSLSLLFIIVGVTGIIVSGIIFKNYRSNEIMNVYFILFIGIVSLKQFSIGISHFFIEKNTKNWFYENASFSALIFPLIYLYFKSLTITNKTFGKKDFFTHFSFPILFFLLVLIQSYSPYKLIKPKYEYIESFISFVFLLCYDYLCYKLLLKNIWSTNENKSKKPKNDLIKKWTKFIFLVISIAPLKPLIVFIIVLNEYKTIFNHNFFPVTSILLLIIYFKILCSPEILYGYGYLKSKINSNTSSNLKLHEVWNLSEKEIQNNLQDKILKNKINPKLLEYTKKIEQLIFENQLFLGGDFTINLIANKLNIPKSHLIYLFKYHSKISFIEFKKIVRIHYAIKLIEDDFLSSNTLNSLSKKVGFTSYDPFYRSFKEITGNGPSEYYNIIRKNNHN